MKLKYEQPNNKETKKSIMVFILVLILFFIMNMTLEDIWLVIIFIPLIPLSISIDKNNTPPQKQTNDCEKIQGYIICCYRKQRKIKYNIYYENYINVLANNKIYEIKKLENNEAYKKLEGMLIPVVSSIDPKQFKIKKIPIDMYIKDDKYYADLESVEIS